jgi:methionyl-tRNA formyltransferase
VLRADAEGIVVACSRGSVALLKIQLPGKKAMDARTFLHGNKIEIGAVLR